MNFLITGGASGLGRAITKAVALQFPGSAVHCTYHSSADAAKAMEADHKNVHTVKCDFRNENEVKELCQFVLGTEIEVLVNNAFTGLSKQYFHKTETEVFTEGFRADVWPTLQITRSFIQKARERRSGKIITILTSALSAEPPIGWSVYLANKMYLLAMHRSWVAENRSFQIISNCISPDFMATPLHRDTDERVIENMIKAHPVKRLLTVEEVADVVIFLSKASPQLNGQNIVLNAGMFG